MNRLIYVLAVESILKKVSNYSKPPEIFQHIAGTEDGVLIIAFNSVRSENARDKLTRNI